ncbi:CHAD domain-containing protein [Kitasatospora sp. DSM 101779]|uniref:CHAD domain-containing protein n=1 Tax=Kitasatospora sp. DSM 101779 TaxID=2853165 RepID=UPI0021D9295D|nr:CHAD domain-containing protein [Kitasatospora sp. DSM 101779]MCU7821349.1 CHAD domain-containing protein [Kitasatospora sp. DSM 101779]
MPHGAEPTAGTVLGGWISRQTETLAGLADAVRADEPDAVHRMRVTCRRLRSTLQAYRPLIGADTSALVIALRDLASDLGAARDTEVLAERLTADARALPEDCRPDEVVAALAAWAAERTAGARPEALAALDGPGFPALLAALRGLVAEPHFTARADRPAPRELARVARRQQRRTARRIEAARGAAPGEATATALHEARKAAKRARYAGEPAGPAADRFTRRMRDLQDLLGTHQDAVLAGRTLHGLAAADPQHAFAYGVLYDRQLTAAAADRARLPKTWRRASEPASF